MDFQTYSDQTARTAGATRAMSPDETQLLCHALGLAGEAGEFADKVKKLFFHDHPISPAELTKELGDVLWYWSRAIPAINALFGTAITADDVAGQNLAKLMVRYPDGFTSEASLARVDVAA